MLDDLRAGDWIPRSVRETADRIEQAHQALVAELGRRPEEGEIAGRLGISLPEYHELLRKSRAIPLLQIEDLKSHWKEDEGNIFDILEDPSFTNPLEALSLHDLKDRLADAIMRLPEKEQLVLSLYYDEELNLREIGEVLGITESRVSQIRTQAILRLRAFLKTTLSPDLIEAAFARRSV
jgi:RNA polymerase sigma factor for flagellar operon FliA